MGRINDYIKRLIKRTKKEKDSEKPWLDLYDGVPDSLDYYSGSLYDAIKESGDKYSNLVAYEYFGKRCFLSFLIPSTVEHLCSNNERDAFFRCVPFGAHFFAERRRYGRKDSRKGN